MPAIRLRAHGPGRLPVRGRRIDRQHRDRDRCARARRSRRGNRARPGRADAGHSAHGKDSRAIFPRGENAMSYGTVKLETEGELAIVTLNRPEKRNALSPALIEDLLAALDAVETSAARAAILTGAGPAF